MHISEDYEALLAEKGIDLSDLSIAGSALRREDAFTAIKLLQRDSVPLLGGEVFLKENSKISFPVDLWTCEQKRGDTIHAYAIRSGEDTRAYITRLGDPTGKEFIFKFVVMDGTTPIPY
jgi:hypothetical protein